MKLLLDTHAFLWFITDDAALSAVAREAILSTDNEVSLSAASMWEMTVKYGLGKTAAPG